MKVVVIGQIQKGNLVALNHPEEIEIELGDVAAFSTNKELRLLGYGKEMYRLSLASYKELKKELSKRGILSRLDLSKKA